MTDYIYNPYTNIQDPYITPTSTPNDDINYSYMQPDSNEESQYVISELQDQSQIDPSTSLEELDYINRNLKLTVPTPDNPYPDPLEKPITMKVIPEGGIIGNKRLKNMSKLENDYNDSLLEKSKLYNLSLKNFSTKIGYSLIEIINDLLSYINGNYNKDFLEIFTKEDRLITIGILCVVISVFYIFFKNIE